MKLVMWFVTQSIILDYKFLVISDWGILKKLNFIFIKYLLIVKHLFVKFELGTSNVELFGKKVYYDSKYGIAGYQSLLARHQRLLKLAQLNNVRTVLDVGANVGFFTLLVKELYPNATTYSFEPIPTTFSCLENNVKGYDHAEYYNYAVGDTEGEVSFEFDNQNSAVSKISDAGVIKAKIITLEKFALDNGFTNIDLLKIDTETFEQHVLVGAKSILKNVKYLFIEITLENNQNYTISSIMSHLHSTEYNFDLVGFRNYADTSEGKMPIMDALLVNKKLQ